MERLNERESHDEDRQAYSCGVFRHVNLLVPAKNSLAQMGQLIMEPRDMRRTSDSNSICVATVLPETGIIPIRDRLLDTHQHMLDPTDPYPRGYRLSDAWPK